MNDQDDDRLKTVRLALLRGKTQRYLRYLHLRDALTTVADEVTTICVAGTGHGLAELALALEFPHITWMLTDIRAKEGGYPNYYVTMEHCWRWGIDRVMFSLWNTMAPTDRSFDMVCSTEMLEHVPNTIRAAENMRRAARKYVYCMVPYASDETNSRPDKRADAWERFEHYVCGFNSANLQALFGWSDHIQGAYWSEAGGILRSRLATATPEEISRSYLDLVDLAERDLMGVPPEDRSGAMGIRILARSDAKLVPDARFPKPWPAIDVVMKRFG